MLAFFFFKKFTCNQQKLNWNSVFWLISLTFFLLSIWLTDEISEYFLISVGNSIFPWLHQKKKEKKKKKVDINKVDYNFGSVTVKYFWLIKLVTKPDFAKHQIIWCFFRGVNKQVYQGWIQRLFGQSGF